MSALKSDLKMLAFSEVGARVDDLLEASEKDILRHEGGSAACGKVRDSIRGLLEHMQSDIDNGAYDLELAAHIKRYILRAEQFATNTAVNEDIAGMMARGRVAAHKDSIALVKGFFEGAKQQRDHSLQAAEAATAAGGDEDDSRRPAPSLKAQRLAEDAPPKRRGRPRARNT